MKRSKNTFHPFAKLLNNTFYLLLMSSVILLGCHTKTPTISHLVAVKFKDTASPEVVAEFSREFSKLPEKILNIKGFDCGTNSSKEQLNKGFTHLYRFTFSDTTHLQQYLKHPAHTQFAEYASRLDIIDDIFVFDYQSDELY